MDSVQIRCTKCKNVFRDRARRLQNGYSRQCPCCEVVLFFDEDSQDANIKRAMRLARRVRRELRDAEIADASATKRSDRASRRLTPRDRSRARDAASAD